MEFFSFLYNGKKKKVNMYGFFWEMEGKKTGLLIKEKMTFSVK